MINVDMIHIFQEFRENLDEFANEAPLQEENTLNEKLEGFYQSYIEKERTFFHFAGTSDVLAFFPDDADGLCKAEMLAVLLYQDAMIQNDMPTKKDLLEKSWLLYQYVCATSNNFSYDRVRMINKIEYQWRGNKIGAFH